MRDFFFRQQWGWKTSGIALGFIIVIAVMLVKPIGVSTQYVIFDGVLWSTANTELIQTDPSNQYGYSSVNPYLNKGGGQYAKAISKPFNYGLVFVVSMIFGGFLASKLRSSTSSRDYSLVPQQRLSNRRWLRYCAAFLGGVLVLFGARLAGGCTSGHMMSGMMQTSYSAYVFTVGVFLIAVPTALLFYRRPNTRYLD